MELVPSKCCLHISFLVFQAAVLLLFPFLAYLIITRLMALGCWTKDWNLGKWVFLAARPISWYENRLFGRRDANQPHTCTEIKDLTSFLRHHQCCHLISRHPSATTPHVSRRLGENCSV
jgi:hypothetical protein